MKEFDIFDQSGRIVERIVDIKAGKLSVGEALRPGIYILRATGEEDVRVLKLEKL